MTFNNILRKIWGLPRQCHTTLLHFTAAVDSVFITVYNRSLRLVSSAINSDSIILHDVAPNWHIVSLATIVFLDGSTLNFTLNKMLFVPASCVMSSLTRHPIALLSVMTFILPAVYSSFISYLYVFVHCMFFCCLFLFSSPFSLS